MTPLTWPADWRVVILGCGSAGSRLARLLQELGAPRITGLDITPDPPSMWPGGLAYGRCGGENWVRDPLPGELYFVCTPAGAHLNGLNTAFRQGARGVFVEKPVAAPGDLHYLEMLAAAVEARGIVCQVGYCWRWHPAVLAAKEWLDSQPLESVRLHAVCAADMSRWPGAINGTYQSALLEMSHELDTARRLLGPGRVVAARTQNYSRPNSDPFIGRRAHPLGWSLAIHHTTGAITTVDLLPDYAGYFRSLSLISARAQWRWFTDNGDSAGEDPERGQRLGKNWVPEDMYRAELVDFLRAVFEGAAVKAPLREAIEVLTWCSQAEGLAK